jgi:hypothetical protein
MGFYRASCLIKKIMRVQGAQVAYNPLRLNLQDQLMHFSRFEVFTCPWGVNEFDNVIFIIIFRTGDLVQLAGEVIFLSGA